MKSLFQRKYKHEIVVCAVAKNEENYIEEWVQHHLSIGFEKIFIYDNNDVFGKLSALLESYINLGQVVIIDCSNRKAIQLWAYKNFVETYKKSIKWAAFLDVDEFVELENSVALPDFVNSFSQHTQVIALSWLGYGANNKIWKEEGGVVQRFPEPPLIEQEYASFSTHIKSIARLQNIKCFRNPHFPSFFWKKYPVTYNALGVKIRVRVSRPFVSPVYANAYIKHYFTKSYEEWLEKVSRGFADAVVGNRKIDEFFYLNSEMRHLNLPKTLNELNELKKQLMQTDTGVD